MCACFICSHQLSGSPGPSPAHPLLRYVTSFWGDAHSVVDSHLNAMQLRVLVQAFFLFFGADENELKPGFRGYTERNKNLPRPLGQASTLFLFLLESEVRSDGGDKRPLMVTTDITKSISLSSALIWRSLMLSINCLSTLCKVNTPLHQLCFNL